MILLQIMILDRMDTPGGMVKGFICEYEGWGTDSPLIPIH